MRFFSVHTSLLLEIQSVSFLPSIQTGQPNQFECMMILLTAENDTEIQDQPSDLLQQTKWKRLFVHFNIKVSKHVQ